MLLQVVEASNKPRNMNFESNIDVADDEEEEKTQKTVVEEKPNKKHKN